MNKIRLCLNCGVVLAVRHKIKFCSNKCQIDYQHAKWVDAWKKGKIDGNIGITARNFSAHLKKYLIDKFGGKCCVCGWNKNIQSLELFPLKSIILMEIRKIAWKKIYG